MADPNSCATCKHKRGETGSAWCYMFREQPEPLCMQHQDRKPKRIGTIGHVGTGKTTLVAAIAAAIPCKAHHLIACVQCAEDRRLAAMFAGDDDSLAVVPNEGAKK